MPDPAEPPCHEEYDITALADHPTASGTHAFRTGLRARLSVPATTAERWLLALLLLWLLVGPRVELPVAGLRVEDLVFAALAAVCLLHLHAIGLPRAVTVVVVAVAVAGILSSVVAGARGTLDPFTGVLYAVRPLEYWIAFPATLLLLRSAEASWARRLDVILAVTTVLQTAFAVLQYYFDIPIGFSHAAYTRAAGLTVGPYELGAISAMLIAYWIARGRWVLASVAVVALGSSVARISILGAAAAFAVLAVFWIVRQARRVRAEGWREAFRVPARSGVRIAVQVVAVATAGVVLAFTFGLITLPDLGGPAQNGAAPVQPVAPSEHHESPSPTPTPTPTPTASTDAPVAPQAPAESVTTRLQSTSVLGSWDVAAGIAAAVPPPATAADYQNIAYAHLNDYVNAGNAAASGAEPSNLVRFFRWHLILDTVNDPVDVVLGLGPSFVGPSVDGSYLRFFADGGVLGVLVWLALIVLWLRRSPLWMVCVSITLLVGALFIDILYAERPMVLYWMLLGLAVATAAARRQSTDRAPEPAADGS